MFNSRKHVLLVAAASTRRLCTEAATVTTTTTTSTTRLREDSLYGRLSILGSTDGSVVETMNKWEREGNLVKKLEIERCIKLLRKYKRSKHALELFDWMEKRGTNLSHGDYAIRINLLSKVEGVASAEKYFMSLPEPAKNQATYGALLNCYCTEKMPEKAMEHLEKMRELNIASNILVYNNLMALYMRLEQPEKVPPLVQEMKSLGILPNTVTYNILMKSYASLEDIEGVERIMAEMEAKGKALCDWTTYSNLAAIYIAARLLEKADSALKEMEKRSNHPDRIVFEFLISMYASTGNLAEVKRVWESLKLAFPKTTNLSYLVMLQSLSRLADLDGMKMCFGEWEAGFSSYDMRLANIMISAYLRRDMLKEAVSLLENTRKKGVEPNTRTMELFMDFYLKHREASSALKCMEFAVSAAKKRTKWQLNQWQPNQSKVSGFMNIYEESKDVGGVEEFYKLLKEVDSVDSEVYYLLLRTYVAAEKTDPLMRQRIEEDGIEVGPETEKLLQSVCPL